MGPNTAISSRIQSMECPRFRRPITASLSQVGTALSWSTWNISVHTCSTSMDLSLRNTTSNARVSLERYPLSKGRSFVRTLAGTGTSLAYGATNHLTCQFGIRPGSYGRIRVSPRPATIRVYTVGDSLSIQEFLTRQN